MDRDFKHTEVYLSSEKRKLCRDSRSWSTQFEPWYVYKIFRKTNISYPLICTRRLLKGVKGRHVQDIKGTLMQIRKFHYMFGFLLKQYPENFAFLILRILELFSHEVCIFLKK